MDPNAIKLVFNIHCQRPSWVFSENNFSLKEPVYRLYLNSELYTERKWVHMDPGDYIREELWFVGDKGTEYTLKLEPILSMKAQAKFKLSDPAFNSNLIDILEQTEHSLKFKLL